MTRGATARLEDIQEAVRAIRSHMARGDLDDGLIFDAVRVRVIEIGEAVKHLDKNLLVLEPAVPWSEIARIRDRLAHRYFDTTHAIIRHVIESELHPLEQAVARIAIIAERLESGAING